MSSLGNRELILSIELSEQRCCLGSVYEANFFLHSFGYWQIPGSWRNGYKSGKEWESDIAIQAVAAFENIQVDIIQISLNIYWWTWNKSWVFYKKI